jgi:hypothetical protein
MRIVICQHAEFRIRQRLGCSLDKVKEDVKYAISNDLLLKDQVKLEFYKHQHPNRIYYTLNGIIYALKKKVDYFVLMTVYKDPSYDFRPKIDERYSKLFKAWNFQARNRV